MILERNIIEKDKLRLVKNLVEKSEYLTKNYRSKRLNSISQISLIIFSPSMAAVI